VTQNDDAESPPRSLVGSLPGLIRKARRIADLSQRELARRARISSTTVGRVEAGTLVPSLQTLEQMLNAARLLLVVVDADGRVVRPMQIWQDVFDGADRLYPAHLDTILDPRFGEWWADTYGLARPPETFRRNRRIRDAERRRSQWEVRVAQYRNDPPPPEPGRVFG
jgi:transcriptional regulator with XRE-family HTH domain